jgi:hypothetical protein
MESSFKLGDILVFDGEPCVVVGLSGQTLNKDEIPVPEEHIAVWFGGNNPDRWTSEPIQATDRIEVWTIPEEYFKKGPEPLVSH